MNHTKMESITAKIISPKTTAKWLEPWKIKTEKKCWISLYYKNYHLMKKNNLAHSITLQRPQKRFYFLTELCFSTWERSVWVAIDTNLSTTCLRTRWNWTTYRMANNKHHVPTPLGPPCQFLLSTPNLQPWHSWNGPSSLLLTWRTWKKANKAKAQSGRDKRHRLSTLL